MLMVLFATVEAAIRRRAIVIRSNAARSATKDPAEATMTVGDEYSKKAIAGTP